MPLSNVLATPFEVTEEDRERIERRRLQNFDEENSENPENLEGNSHERSDSLLSKQTMLRVKCCELIATIATIVFFIYEKSQSNCINVDLLISSFFGALLMYSVVILSIPNHNSLLVLMMLLNLTCSLMLFTIGYFQFSSWYDLKTSLMAEDILPGDSRSEVATFQFLVAIFSFIIGIAYSSEVFIQIYDNIRHLL